MSAAVRTLASGTLPLGSGRFPARYRRSDEPLPADHEVMHRLSFPTFAGGGQRCRPVARYGGIHFQSGDYADRGLDRQVAQFV
jgi:hypothetical protein